MKPAKKLQNLLNMRYTHGQLQDMVDFLRTNSTAGERLWLAAPYISSFNTIQYLFNLSYLKKHKTNFKLITDIKNASIYNRNILEFFIQNGELRTLENLHAKLYLMGKHAVITSANMTYRAFFVNYETGVADTNNDKYEILFESLWNNSTPVTQEELEINIKNSNINFDEDTIYSSMNIRELPPELTSNSNYVNFLKNYKILMDEYETTGRIWNNNTPLKFEIDAFLNYLFHHSPNHKSSNFYTNNSINIDANEKLLTNCKKEFFDWITSDVSKPYDNENKRKEFATKAKLLFSKTHIEKLTVKQCAEFLGECANTYLKNGVRFNWMEKFEKSNDIETIIKYIGKLKTCEIEKIDNIVNNSPVNFMGISTSQEILGLLRDELPIRNENTNAGLRYLGYEA